MDRETAIQEVKERWRELFPADKKKRGIICPICGSGSGAHGTGITANRSHGKPNSLKCWSCNFTGDAIDLIMQTEGLEFNAALEYAAGQLGFTIDRATAPARSETKSTPKPEPRTNQEKTPKQDSKPAAEVANYAEYYLECNARINDPAAVKYLSFRGLTPETANYYCLGYDPQWVSPTVRKSQQEKGSTWTPDPTARLIIPVNNNHYIARATDPKANKDYAKMNETGGGEVEIFNERVLETAAPVFVVEGAIDALSIIEAGGNALALNSTSNARKLLEKLEKNPTKATLILSLDNDDAGQRTQTELAEGLKRLNISYITADIAGGAKDPNAALTTDKKAFKERIEQAQYNAAARPDNTAGYIDNFMEREILELMERSNIKTGFAELDKQSSGLYPGLYVIAATSSLGKTTFVHQISDQLAAAGQEVLFFSLEQSRLELVSKSLARIIKQMQQGTIKGTERPESITPVTSLDIRRGRGGALINIAANEYKDRVKDRLSIIEGNFNCNISFIGDYIRQYIKRTGSRPIVVVDYLQILQPATEDKRGTAKETIDMTVTELKRISRENNLTVFVISSVNRTNYLNPIDFESIKESGGVEYTADVIWGLQLNCINEPLFAKEKGTVSEKRERIRQAKAAKVRDIQLICLKNRYGIASFDCLFNYEPEYDLFTQRTGESKLADENPFIRID